MSAMVPAQLTPESFHRYPPQGQKLCVEHLDLLRELPLSMTGAFLPSAANSTCNWLTLRDSQTRSANLCSTAFRTLR
jgi:hypothetical protein